MPRNEVEIVMTAQDAQQQAAWARQRKWITEVEKGLERVIMVGKRAGKESEESFGAFGKKLANVGNELQGMIGKFFAINTAIQLFRKEVDAIKMRNQNALDSQLNIAGAQRGAIVALGTGANIGQEELIRRVQAQNFVDQATMYATAQHAIGTGAMGAGRSLDTAIAAAEFYPHLKDQLPDIAGGALEIQKSFPEFGARQSIAMLAELQAVDPTVDPGKFARNAATAIGQGRAFGGGKDSASFLGSLLSGIGQRAGDTEGAISGTAMINFLEQVLEEGIKHGLYKKGTSTEEQLRTLRGDSPGAAAVRRKLQGALSDEYNPLLKEATKSGSDSALRTRARTMVPLMELLEPGSRTLEFVERARRQTQGTPAEILSRQEQAQRRINALPGQQAFAGQRVLDVGMEQLRSDPQRSLRALRQQLVQGLYEAGGTFKSYQEAEAFVDMGISEGQDLTPEEQFRKMAGMVGERRKSLSSGRVVAAGVGAFTPQFQPQGQPTAGEARSAAALQRMEKLLIQQATLLEEQNTMMRGEQGRQPNRAPPRPSPAGGLNDRR